MSARSHLLGLPGAVWAVLGLGLAAVGLLLALDRFQQAAWEYEVRLGRLAGVAHRHVGVARRARPESPEREQALRRATSLLEGLAEAAAEAARDEGDADDLVLQDRARELAARLARVPPGRVDDAWIDDVESAAGELEDLVAAHAAEHREITRAKLERAIAAWIAALLLAALALLWRERRRREAEAALEESRRRLAQAQKMEAVGRLAGGIAHDINNHLAAIRSQCELVQRKDMPRQRVLETMGIVGDTVVKASSLVERLLGFAGRQPSHPELVDLDEVVRGLTEVLGGTLPAEVSLELRAAPGLGLVEIDLSQIEQVLVNLFVNARDAIAGAGRIVISTANGIDAGRPVVRLAVEDTGCGIPPENRDKIFDPFFTTKAGQGSSGLGLATVYTLVEEAGGRIDVESQPGAGTTLTVSLPRAAEAGAPRPAADPAEVGGHERVLLVDDNAELADAARTHLEGLGYTVRVATSVEQAVATAAGEPFDVVVSDVRLADGTGPDLVRRIRRGQPVRALYMSGYTDRVALRSETGPGEAFFIKKPFSLAGLARTVRALLDEPVETRSTA